MSETIVRADSLMATPQPSLLQRTINEKPPQQGSAPPESIIVAPKSKAPWIVLGLTAIAVAGAAGVVLRGPGGGSDVVVPPPPPKVTEVKPPDPVKQPNPPAPSNPGIERDAERGRDYLARGKNAWERGALEEAYQFFKDVPDGTEFKTESNGLMKDIDTIREKLKAAQAQQHRGNCEGAIPLFNEVLKLNSKITDASGGLKACQAAALPGTME
jgi:hypothetical protein